MIKLGNLESEEERWWDGERAGDYFDYLNAVLI